MTIDGRLETRLRRGGEDVRTHVARPASAPPMDRLQRRASSPRPWAVAAALLIVLGGGLAITFVARGDDQRSRW